MKKLFAFLVVALMLSGCTAQLQIGIDMDSKWAEIPMSDDFKFVAPGKTFELSPGLMVKTVTTEAMEFIPVSDPDNPYNEIYSDKGRFLVVKLIAWNDNKMELPEKLPLMMSINVLGWADEILTDTTLIKKLEQNLGIPFLKPKLLTAEKQEFFICFPIEGASLGWIIHIYKTTDGELFLEKRIDTGI